jgi:hypothetical protein
MQQPDKREKNLDFLLEERSFAMLRMTLIKNAIFFRGLFDFQNLVFHNGQLTHNI